MENWNANVFREGAMPIRKLGNRPHLGQVLCVTVLDAASGAASRGIGPSLTGDCNTSTFIAMDQGCVHTEGEAAKVKYRGHAFGTRSWPGGVAVEAPRLLWSPGRCS